MKKNERRKDIFGVGETVEALDRVGDPSGPESIDQLEECDRP